MLWVTAWCVLVTVYGGGGVTQTSDPQLWADYKIFDHVYGKIFDKELYGESLPPTIRLGDKTTKVIEKKEVNTHEFDPYSNEKSYSLNEKPSSTFNFLSYNGFKPISETSDPDTYYYLKRLEEMERDKITDVGFKPYKDNDRPEETYAYKVIQNILDAHEANQGKDDDNVNSYLTFMEKKKNNKRKPPRVTNAAKICYQGRCRKRSSGSSTRVRAWPYYRRIKHRIY